MCFLPRARTMWLMTVSVESPRQVPAQMLLLLKIDRDEKCCDSGQSEIYLVNAGLQPWTPPVSCGTIDQAQEA